MEEAKYVTTAGGVKFKDGASGSLSFICPVSTPLPDGRYAVGGKVNLTNPNYNGIEFALRRVNLSTGSVQDVVASDSVRWNPGPNPPYVYVETARGIPVDFDFDSFAYWVQITHRRSDLGIRAVVISRRGP